MEILNAALQHSICRANFDLQRVEHNINFASCIAPKIDNRKMLEVAWCKVFVDQKIAEMGCVGASLHYQFIASEEWCAIQNRDLEPFLDVVPPLVVSHLG